MTAPAKTRQNVLTVGALIEQQVGRTQIRLMRVTAEAWTVEVYVGTQRIADQCSSFTDEVTAALTASGYYQLAVEEQAAADLARPLTPGETRIHATTDVEVRVLQTPAGGYLVQLRKGGEIVPDACRHHMHETPALHYFAALVATFPKEVR